MKIIGKVSQDEMVERFPGLMDALNSDPKDVGYCSECDGLRHKDHDATHHVAMPQIPELDSNA